LLRAECGTAEAKHRVKLPSEERIKRGIGAMSHDTGDTEDIP